jgi:large subunit ribosomal protein L2
MGKSLISQKRGKGSSTYRAPSFRYYPKIKYLQVKKGESFSFKIKDIIKSQPYSAPIAELESEEQKIKTSMIAVEGLKTGDIISIGYCDEIKPGNVLPLSKIPEGTVVCNLEANPGDGGKLVRASGTFAKIVGRMNDKVIVLLPSKKERIFDENCFATIGCVAGFGRKEKPFLKAGTRYYYMKARNKRYPGIHGTSMNAIQHPFGGSSSAHKGRPTIAPKNAPPGRKVGKLRPKRTGRTKR